ncbi:MAG: ADP-ribosylglycohydrolase family protein [Methanocorpusculum parvum]|nr:ADP-ribosylglycohydrolase family protein [Methanocorpusculum parvum]
MLNIYRGCLIGAVLGDALGMPYETLPARRLGRLAPPAFGRAYRGHPNHDLLPGQYTDDGQIMLISARNLIDGDFNGEEYAKELLRTHTLNKFRFPDSVLFSACKRMETTKNLTDSGVNADSAGCLSLAIPFALAFRDRRVMAKALIPACCITHTHPASHAGTLGLALMLNTLLETHDVDAAFAALDSAAQNMDAELYTRLQTAYRFERNGMSVDEAAAVIGTSSSVYQTLPMAAFLCKRFFVPEELLSAAVTCGGNAGTITMICGAFAGARFGIESLPGELLHGLERASVFTELADKLYQKGERENEAAEADAAEESEEKKEE